MSSGDLDAATFDRFVRFCISAHAEHPKKPSDSTRFFDRKTPYSVHPIWCAVTVLCEPKLPGTIRIQGYQALLLHDVLEDTTVALPEWVSPGVAELVRDMTFRSLKDETREVWNRSDLIKLLKLYDKVSNVLDGVWMSAHGRAALLAYTLRLTDFVLERYGDLNITRIARAVCGDAPGV